jgi:hypothetical protein
MGSTSIADTRVNVVSEWIIHAGLRLLGESLLNSMSSCQPIRRMRSMAAPTEEVLYISGQEGSILSDCVSGTAN